MTAVQEATKPQWRAADPVASVWVEASAGSGKTTVLANRVLALLLDGVAPERLLCLTFTKVAAAEMANRITDRLADWATMAEGNLPAALHKLTGQWPEDAALARARGLFARVLDTAGGLKIQTIHSFCQSVLARFPLEAGVPPQFMLLDEDSAGEELGEARRRVLIRARSGDDIVLTAAVERVAGLAEDERFAALLSGVIGERGRLRRLITRMGGVDGAITALAEVLTLTADATPEREADLAWAVIRQQEGDWRSLAGDLSGLGKTTAKIADGLLAALAAANPVDGLDGLCRAALTSQGTPRKLPAKQAAHLAEIWQQRTDWLLAVQARRASARVLASSAALMRLADAVLQEYEQAKRSRAWLDFDDLILTTRQLLEQTGGVSWVLYKLDGGIDHVLVDEAQDTNPDQWAVVQALAQEFFAGLGAGDRQRSLFVVGDAKQSIFSFQRADPAAFRQMQGVFRHQVVEAGQDWREVPLAYSFRSVPAVLRAVDAVFANPIAGRGVVAPGSLLEHRAVRDGQPGLVELWPLAASAEDPPEEPWTLPRQRRSVESADSRLARLIAAQIQRWLGSGDILASTRQPIRAGDILVLVRRRTAFGDALVRALKQRGIPVAGQDRLRLTGHLAVMDLLALGRFLVLPDDDLTLAALLKSPLVGLSEEDLLRLAADRGKASLWAQLGALAEQDSGFAAARDYLGHWLGRADYQPPYELFADLLAQGGRRRLLARLGEEAADPIDEFLTRCLLYERDHEPSLQGLLHWLESAEPEIKRESDATGRNEVRIMTAHGAKGLQAPIVILPDTTAVPNPAQDDRARLLWTPDGVGPLWCPSSADRDGVTEALYNAYADAQQQEYRRLLYVAMTRAEDRLYIAGAARLREAGEDRPCWYDLIRTGLAPIAETVTFDFADLGFADWQGEGLRLVDAGTVAPPAPATPDAITPPPAPLPAWIDQPAPLEPRPSRPLSPSDPGEDPPVRSPLAGGPGIGYRRGRLVHRLLQTLPDAAPHQWDDLAPALLNRFAPDIDPAETAQLADEVLAVLADPACAALFGPGSRAEVPVTGRVGTQIIAGRVDRLAVLGDRVLVVDFKTNRPPPTLVNAVAPAYLRQMALYRALLRQIYPAQRIETGLVWTDGPRIMWLPDDLLDHAVKTGLDTNSGM